MAIIRKVKGKLPSNTVLANVSGMFNGLVVKQYKDKVVITGYTPPSKRRKKTPAQIQNCELFREAVTYAQRVAADPKLSAAYARKLKGKRNVFQAALAEYMRKKGEV